MEIEKEKKMLNKFFSLSAILFFTCGLYYKLTTIVNDDSRVINKLETSLNDCTRVFIYNHHMFIVQTTGVVYH
jgi:hypothetical protein